MHSSAAAGTASLLRAGADWRFRNRDGWTAFHLAARAGSMESARILLASSGNDALEMVTCCSNNGRTPFQSACLSGELECAQLIWKTVVNESSEGAARAMVQQVDNCNRSAMSDARDAERADVAEFLRRILSL